MCKKNRSYHILTLKPKSSEEQRLFWEFRCKDVRECYHYVVALGLVVIFGNILVLLLYRDKKSFDNLSW